MPDQPKEQEHYQAILKSLDDAIEKGIWDISPFYQAMRDKLVSIRDRFKKDSGLEAVADAKLKSAISYKDAHANALEVFISIYNAEGASIAKWENILYSVTKHIISRPVYRNESDVKAALRAARDKQNECYISAFIKPDDIIPQTPEKTPHDRFGNELLVLKPSAVTRQNIQKFIHTSGVYEYENFRLIRLGAADFLKEV